MLNIQQRNTQYNLRANLIKNVLISGTKNNKNYNKITLYKYMEFTQ